MTVNIATRDTETTGAVFRGDLSAPEPIPEEAIAAAVELMRDGRLFRYGETGAALPVASVLEEEYAAYMGTKYCVAVNSGGCAIYLGLKAAGVEVGDKVLINAFTLAPVPGAIAHAGGDAVMVDIDDRFVIDVDDLDRKAAESGAKYLLLSYMRGHLPDMDAVMAVVRKHDLKVIEDCAHAMGATWDDQKMGTFGVAGCFSAQSFKQVNSGEGGLLVTDDEDIAAKAILLSGSYMLYEQHRARPDMAVFDRHKYTTPNCSMRMTGLAATLLRYQIPKLDERNTRWREIYNDICDRLRGVNRLRLPERPAKEGFAPTSLQFILEDVDAAQIERFTALAGARGVHVKWFGAADPVGFTSRHEHWKYVGTPGRAARADDVLHRLCDMRLPIWLSKDDCKTIAEILTESIAAA